METTARAQHTPADYRPYSQIDLLDSQLKRLPMWARLAIASADARLNKGNRERAALLAALEELSNRPSILHCICGDWPSGSIGPDNCGWHIARAAIAQARGDA